MDQVSQHLQHAKVQVSESLKQIYAQVEQQLPENFEQHVKSYVEALSSTTPEKLYKDISGLKATPATVTLALVALPTLLVAGKVLSRKESPRAKKPRAKKARSHKASKAQKANREIQTILDYVEETYVPEIDLFIENYADFSDEDQQYKFKYFEEMLLKELMKLDGIETTGSDVLRENRKKVIRFIQDHQRRLDNFKKDMS